MSESVSQASQIQEQSLPPGTRLEEFVIERILGSGGFGITYLAKDSRLGRQVVIKENLPAQFCWREPSSLTVRPRHSQGEDAESFAWSLENFEKEAAMLASLDHPGIVRVLRSFEAFGTAFFVMPFVEGKPLDEEIRDRRDRGGAFSEEELVGLLRRMLDALEYLHVRGIYHRDIKPGNILITQEGVPVLIDFGSARQRLSERSLTVIESPGYTPFEQLQSRGKIGPWSDLYALGGTLCKAITGETPPKAADRIMEDPFVPLSERPELVERYSRELLTSIDRSMAPQVNDRLRSSSEWREGGWRAEGGSESTESLISADQTERGADLSEMEAMETTRELSPKSLRSHEAESPLRTPLPKPCSTINKIGSSDAKSTTPQARKKSNNTVVIASGAAIAVVLALVIYVVMMPAGHPLVWDGPPESPEDLDPSVAAGVYAEPLGQSTNSTQSSESGGLDRGAIGDSRSFEIGGGQKVVLKYVPGGEFLMGSPAAEEERRDDEKQVRVKLSSHYWMGETEVTQGQWEAVMGTTPAQQKAKGQAYGEVNGVGASHPMYFLSYDDAVAFIGKLNAKSRPASGWQWALPSEAEWEQACRGGTETVFSYGNSLDSTQANFDGNYPYGNGKKGADLEKTAAVKSYAANGYGLYDMHGNVWEWCSDWYGETLPGGMDPQGAKTGSFRVLRGGSWDSFGRFCRSAYRCGVTPVLRDFNLGFRLAAVPEER